MLFCGVRIGSSHSANTAIMATLVSCFSLSSLCVAGRDYILRCVVFFILAISKPLNNFIKLWVIFEIQGSLQHLSGYNFTKLL
jgi:hypothetical protein